MAHFPDIRTATKVGLGRDLPAVGMLAHRVRIGNHHPVVAVDKHLHKPTVNFVRIEFTQKHKPSQHHQTLNVVAVARLQDATDRIVNRLDSGCPIVKTEGDGARVIPMVSRSHRHAKILVGCSNELTPTCLLYTSPSPRDRG